MTLSACETALGRFDTADNLRRLPAVLLLSGVSTIVGSLWPLETNTAEHFFTGFYQRLADGATKLDAYREALAETRREHPEYRDRGAFYFMGDWS